jgi:protocatechuate 3,4-dioxygenase beta subunit
MKNIITLIIAMTMLVLYGHLLDASGDPQAGYAVEIWQVDADGICDP